MALTHQQTLPKSMMLANTLATNYMRGLKESISGKKRYMPSGFKTLDSLIPAWLHEGHLIVLAARPSMGKTAFAQQLLEQIAEKQNKTVILFTLEMSAFELTERAIARRAGISVPSLKTEEISTDKGKSLKLALMEFSKLPILVNDSTFDITTLLLTARQTAAQLESEGLPPLGCIFIDYIQLMDSQMQNRNAEVGQITNTLKRLAVELSVPIVALSQLNRNLELRNDKRPIMSDLRDSGEIEQNADTILFLYRDEIYNSKSKDKGVCEVIVGKFRHGKSSTTAKLNFIDFKIQFEDIENA